jgi:hypothetical protein
VTIDTDRSTDHGSDDGNRRRAHRGDAPLPLRRRHRRLDPRRTGGVAGGSITLGAWPVVGLVAVTVLTALLVAFGWALTIRGLGGLIRIVARDGLGRP